ncbi:MAG: malate dehydrogenase [Thermoleophilia bacterium]|nr:malate dehydrogenase [Thermoleophilia bacterium]
MIDPRSNLVQQHAMDLDTAVSALDISVRTGSYDDVAGSDVVIDAAGASQGLLADRMEMLPRNLPLVREIAREMGRSCPDAVVITATNPVDALNYATWRAGSLPRRQVLGYSLNDSLRFRELIARAKGVEVSRVRATVLGEHGNTQVPVFSSARIDGEPVVFSEGEKAGIRAEATKILRRYEALQTGRTAGWTCAVGLAALVRAIRDDTGEVFPCSVVLDGEYGRSGLSMSVPVSVGRRGVRAIQEWELEPDEREGLERSADTLAAAARVVDETLQRGCER